MQAFTFLYQYYTMKRGSAEACYSIDRFHLGNFLLSLEIRCTFVFDAVDIARAFHQLNLGHLAIPYYNRYHLSLSLFLSLSLSLSLCAAEWFAECYRARRQVEGSS
jgi:hypothetical protein